MLADIQPGQHRLDRHGRCQGVTVFGHELRPEGCHRRRAGFRAHERSAFDRLAARHGLEKIKTIGDAYMVAAGLPVPRPDHAEAMANMAIDMLTEFARQRVTLDLDLAIRIGMESGPVVAGVIGRDKFSYDLWGDTVNTASRLESLGLPGRIQVGVGTYQRLSKSLRFEERGEIEVKGKGRIRAYFLIPPDESAVRPPSMA